MKEKILTTSNGVDLFKDENGILHSINMEEVKKELELASSSEDDFEAMYAEDLLELIDFQSGKNQSIKEVDGPISGGMHMLSGIGEYSTQNNDGEDMEITIFQIDGNNYAMALDPDDGYRSYGTIEKTDFTPQYTFPPQQVEIHFFNEEKRVYIEGCGLETYKSRYMIMTDHEKEVLRVGTDYTDYYYPVAIFDYYPENLEINQGK